MTALFHSCFLIGISCFFLISCAKTNSTNNTRTDTTTGINNGPTVYIAGYNGTNPVLWKNGIPDTLSKTLGSANQVILYGNDIYVSGVSMGSIVYNPPGVLSGPETGQYAYWKNDIQNTIGSFGDIDFPATIAIAGNSVYYANGYGWENGAMTTFQGVLSGGGSVRSVFTNGTDIYFAGRDSAQDVVYWKNGILNVTAPYLGRGSTLPLISCMYVSGNDVYIGGMFDRGVYWKNGVSNFLQPRPNDDSFVGDINSIFVSGDDVYTTGKLIAIGLPAGAYLGAAYWKNGIENDLPVITPPDASTFYTTTSVFVSGSDVYVAGYSSYYPPPYTSITDSAVYWKNGIETSLHTPGRANSIYVQ